MISIITLSFPASLPLLPKANNSIYDDDYYYYQNLIIVVKIFSRKDVACMFDVARHAGCSLTKKTVVRKIEPQLCITTEIVSTCPRRSETDERPCAIILKRNPERLHNRSGTSFLFVLL